MARIPRARVQLWKARQAEAYIFRVLSETLWSRDAWILWMTVLVRSLAQSQSCQTSGNPVWLSSTPFSCGGLPDSANAASSCA